MVLTIAKVGSVHHHTKSYTEFHVVKGSQLLYEAIAFEILPEFALKYPLLTHLPGENQSIEFF